MGRARSSWTSGPPRPGRSPQTTPSSATPRPPTSRSSTTAARRSWPRRSPSAAPPSLATARSQLVRGEDGEPWRATGEAARAQPLQAADLRRAGRDGRVHLRRLRHPRRRHGHRPLRARPRRGRLPRRPEVRHPHGHAGRRRRPLLRGRRHGHGRPVVRHGGQRGQPQDHRVAARARHADSPRGHQPQLPALLALQGARHLPCHEPVVRLDGQAPARRQEPPRAGARGALQGAGSTPATPSSASARWSRVARTGASAASATGACPSRPSPARTAARPS